MCNIDFAILLGGSYVDYEENNEYIFVEDDKSLKGRAWYWSLSTNSNICYRDILVVKRDGTLGRANSGQRVSGICPVISPSNFSDIVSNGVRKNGVLEVEYGEYPQYVVDFELGQRLDSEYNIGN